MRGLYLSLVCLTLSVFVLAAGALPVQSRPTGIDERESQIRKRSCSAEDRSLLLNRCGQNRRCQIRVDTEIARNCGARKRSHDEETERPQRIPPYFVATRGRHQLQKNLPKTHRWRMQPHTRHVDKERQ